jgi:RimJ/RimL family protein N-acetyltransferase
VNQPFLIGERLYLRPLELEDADLVRGWLNHPDVRRHLLVRAPLSRLAEESFLRDMATNTSGDRVLVIVVREGEAPIGVIGLHRTSRELRQTELGIAIGEPTRWGQGHGREAIALLLDHAFRELGLHRVQLHVDADHARGIACYTRVGFVREGVRREHSFRDGRFIDTVMMSVLAPEWLARAPKA